MRKKKNAIYYVKKTGFYILLSALALFCLLPMYWMVRSSFMKNVDIFVMDPFVVWPKEMHWENYVKAFQSANFLQYGLNTIIIVAGCMVGTLLTCSMAAYAFARLKWKGKNICFAMLLATMMLPGTVTLIPQFIIWKNLHMVNTFWPLIFPAFLGGGAFNIFLMRQFLLGIPKELDEAATLDGAGAFQIYWRIILPLSRSALVVVALFTFMNNWNDFFGPLIYLNEKQKYTLALGLLQFKGDYSNKWNLMMAASTMVVIPCFAVYVVGQKQLIEGISMTGIKG
ncbi:MAG: carbohydrate ABC transporter permease [Blautia sp.]|nr:carbohydrate ABC transporter permease [Blautia sp.]MDY3999197.1 carbohydrate ABC transporter permease [Blautia sp.]